MLSGCSNSANIGNIDTNEDADTRNDIQIYTIPSSWVTYMGTDISYVVDEYNNFCSYIEIVGDELELGLTDEQKDDWIEQNNELIEMYWTEFEEQSDLYSYIPDGSYQKIVCYFDENLDLLMQAKTVYTIVGYYGLNYILTNNDVNWSVDLAINNCHTNNEVFHVVLPHGEGSYDLEDWVESYNE